MRESPYARFTPKRIAATSYSEELRADIIARIRACKPFYNLVSSEVKKLLWGAEVSDRNAGLVTIYKLEDLIEYRSRGKKIGPNLQVDAFIREYVGEDTPEVPASVVPDGALGANHTIGNERRAKAILADPAAAELSEAMKRKLSSNIPGEVVKGLRQYDLMRVGSTAELLPELYGIFDRLDGELEAQDAEHAQFVELMEEFERSAELLALDQMWDLAERARRLEAVIAQKGLQVLFPTPMLSPENRLLEEARRELMEAAASVIRSFDPWIQAALQTPVSASCGPTQRHSIETALKVVRRKIDQFEGQYAQAATIQSGRRGPTADRIQRIKARAAEQREMALHSKGKSLAKQGKSKVGKTA